MVAGHVYCGALLMKAPIVKTMKIGSCVSQIMSNCQTRGSGRSAPAQSWPRISAELTTCPDHSCMRTLRSIESRLSALPRVLRSVQIAETR